VLDDERVAEVRKSVNREVDEATEAAESAPYPDAVTFDRHVYAD
jgi:TPP-dependent pyruvate/acetoin dehydrogenase alpha subunit